SILRSMLNEEDFNAYVAYSQYVPEGEPDINCSMEFSRYLRYLLELNSYYCRLRTVRDLLKNENPPKELTQAEQEHFDAIEKERNQYLRDFVAHIKMRAQYALEAQRAGVKPVKTEPPAAGKSWFSKLINWVVSGVKAIFSAIARFFTMSEPEQGNTPRLPQIPDATTLPPQAATPAAGMLKTPPAIVQTSTVRSAAVHSAASSSLSAVPAASPNKMALAKTQSAPLAAPALGVIQASPPDTSTKPVGKRPLSAPPTAAG
ncbi:MAG: hypothetical protein V4490_01160, partial [Pseudomonadota bacterium]